MRTITIGFSKPKNRIFPIFSWLIRMFEKTPYSHVYIKWYSPYVEDYITYETSGTMVHFTGNKVFQKRIQPFKEFNIEITNDAFKETLKFCIKNSGIKYGFLQVLGIGLVYLFNLKKNPFRDGKESQICSETIGYILRDKLGYDIQSDLDIAGPRKIYELVSTINNKGE